MPKIIQLSSHIADLIAAGEVVERPGSVVKELVENSIDAGAGAVTVEIQNGGMSLIRVSDDGCGMAPEDAETAFLRHATSKLKKAEDLASIGTLGFRGEALAAISAVSKVDLLTRQAGAAEGVSLYLEAGQVMENTPAGCPEGTTIIIRELFYNTPARLKFMKKDSAEGANVATVAAKLALSHPEVSIRLIRDGKEELHTPGDGKPESAVYSVLGRDFAMNSLKCTGSYDGISVDGVVTSPTASRGNRGWQYFFVNGRCVKSLTMQAALEQAYKNRIMTGRFPGCVLHITTDLSTVDVNVHPAKTEVKFIRDKAIFDSVYYAVLSALDGETKRPQVKFEVKKQPDFFKQMTAEQYRETVSQPVKKSAPLPTVVEREAAVPAVSDSLKGGYAAGRLEKAIAEAASETKKPPLFIPEVQPLPQSVEAASEPEPEPVPVQTAIASQPEAPKFRVIGEALNTYIIVEESDGILLIDKHAAHERILFNRYKKNASELMSQTLLTPIIFKPRAEERAALLENLETLSQFGYDISDFGGGSLVVRSVPADIDGGDAEASLGELAEAIMEGRRLDPTALRDELLHTLACKAAIKAGMISGMAALEALANAVITDPEVRYCPHGRPVAIAMTRASLEKQFKRT